MIRLFMRVVSLSLNAVWAVLLMLAIRRMLRRVSKKYVCLLWAVTGLAFLLPLRMPVPVSPGSVMAYSVHYSGVSVAKAVSHCSGGTLGRIMNEIKTAIYSLSGSAGLRTLAAVWVAGIVFFLIRSAFSCRRIRKVLESEANEANGICRTSVFGNSFVFGVFRPVIVIDAALENEDLAIVLAHEREHLRRGDQYFRLLASAIRCVHWFNPMAWIAFRYFCEDIEMACDEALLVNGTVEDKKAYALLLLNLSSEGRGMSSALSFGTAPVEKRIREILSADTRRARVPAVLVAAMLLLTLMLSGLPERPLTNRATGEYNGVIHLSFAPEITAMDIGADVHGGAVYKYPDEAMEKFHNKYAPELAVFQFSHLLPPLDRWSAELYWEAAVTDGFSGFAATVVRFLDIYENSFK